jgi:hypothetical protein
VKSKAVKNASAADKRKRRPAARHLCREETLFVKQTPELVLVAHVAASHENACGGTRTGERLT